MAPADFTTSAQDHLKWVSLQWQYNSGWRHSWAIKMLCQPPREQQGRTTSMRKLNVINVRFYTVQLSDIQKKSALKIRRFVQKRKIKIWKPPVVKRKKKVKGWSHKSIGVQKGKQCKCSAPRCHAVISFMNMNPCTAWSLACDHFVSLEGLCDMLQYL